MDTIQVFSPGSVANVGCGFDTFGFAIENYGDKLTLSKRNDDQLVIKTIKGADLPMDPENNIATVAINSLLKAAKVDQGFDLVIEKMIAPGSGLGSSACSANAAVFAVNEVLELGYSKMELIPYAMDGEYIASKNYHADNIAPSMLGGFSSIRTYEPELDLFQIDTPEELTVLLIFPQVEIKTSEARKLIKDTLSLKDARQQLGNVAGLTIGLTTSNWSLIGKSLEDKIAEPYRKNLIPYYEEAKSLCMRSGALGFSISGSGPTMFSMFKKEEEISDELIKSLKELYQHDNIETHIFISKINNIGTTVIQ